MLWEYIKEHIGECFSDLFRVCLIHAYQHMCWGSKRVKIPWVKISADLTSWIEPECVPDGFQWANPSKICVGDIFPLFAHWRTTEPASQSTHLGQKYAPFLEMLLLHLRTASATIPTSLHALSHQMMTVLCKLHLSHALTLIIPDQILDFDSSCSDPHILYRTSTI